MQHKMGSKVKDVISGFKGTVTGYVMYITGCNQYLIAPPVSKEGAFKECQWIDESRIAVTTGKSISLNKTAVKKASGFCERAPVR